MLVEYCVLKLKCCSSPKAASRRALDCFRISRWKTKQRVFNDAKTNIIAIIIFYITENPIEKVQSKGGVTLYIHNLERAALLNKLLGRLYQPTSALHKPFSRGN